MKVFQNEIPFIHPLLFSEQESAHIRSPTAMFLTELRERHSNNENRLCLQENTISDFLLQDFIFNWKSLAVPL